MEHLDWRFNLTHPHCSNKSDQYSLHFCRTKTPESVSIITSLTTNTRPCVRGFPACLWMHSEEETEARRASSPSRPLAGPVCGLPVSIASDSCDGHIVGRRAMLGRTWSNGLQGNPNHARRCCSGW